MHWQQLGHVCMPLLDDPEKVYANFNTRKTTRRRRASLAAECPLKGLRAPELASGQAMDLQLAVMQGHSFDFMQHLQAVPEDLRSEYQTSWNSSRAALWGNLAAASGKPEKHNHGVSENF